MLQRGEGRGSGFKVQHDYVSDCISAPKLSGMVPKVLEVQVLRWGELNPRP